MTGPDVDVQDVRPVSRWSLAWRVLAAVALVLLLLNGSLRMSDDVWPFGPLSQYAFSPANDATIVVTRVEGQLADGRRIDLPLGSSPPASAAPRSRPGSRQITADPSLLRAVADGWSCGIRTSRRCVRSGSCRTTPGWSTAAGVDRAGRAGHLGGAA